MAAILLGGCVEQAPSPPAPAPTPLPIAVATEPVGDDADDPAIWVGSANPDSSRILVTNKAAAPRGGLVVFDLAGRTVQRIEGLDRPNNVDVEYGFKLNGSPVDVAVVTERYRRRLRAYRIPGDGGPLEDVSSPDGLTVFDGEPEERGAPMGVGLYRRPSDGTVFAIVSRKEGPETGYLWQYRLEDDGTGRVRAVKVRELGHARPGAEIEAVVVDDELGYAFYAEEARGLHKWHADPDHPEADTELALFGTEGFRGDREGLALFARPDGTGFVLATDQIPDGSRYLVFERRGSRERPHEHSLITVLEGGADDTDGLDATSAFVGPAFPEGLLVAMNSRGRNLLLYDWRSLKLPR
jgi:3-phytase